MKHCERCGNSVSDAYYRVNSVDGKLWSCVACTRAGETLRGPDDESTSSTYNHCLEKIRRGGAIPQKRRD